MNKLVIAFLFISFNLSTQAQNSDEIILTYENWEEYSIADLDTDPKNFPKHEIFFGGYNYEGLLGIGGYVYTQPKDFQIKALAGINGFSGELSYFFKSSTKTIDQTLDIHSKYLGSNIDWQINTRTLTFEQYKAVLPTERVGSFGLTGAVEYYTVRRESDGFSGVNDYNVIHYVVGFSMLSSKHLTFLFNGKKSKRKSLSSKLFIGMVFMNETLFEDQPVTPVELNNLVPRISYEISTSTSPSGRGGLRLLIGYQPPTGLYEGNLGLMLGIGYRRTLG